MKTFDLHQDLLLHLEHPEHFSGEPQTSWEMLEAADVKALFATSFPVPGDGNWHDPTLNNLIEEDFKKYTAYCTAHDNWQIIQNSKQLQDSLDTEANGVILHVEGLNYFEDTEEFWGMLERWKKIGWRSLGIVWNKSNSLGGGTEDAEVGLTPLGEKVIKYCLKSNIVVDLAHASRATFNDVSKLVIAAKKPIFVSHGNADSLCSNERNYTDAQLKTIADSGGAIGVFFSGKFVATESEKNTLEKVADHIDYIKNLVGIDHVALGTDFGGITKGVPRGLESVTQLPELTAELARRGYSEDELIKLNYQNAVRVVSAHLT